MKNNPLVILFSFFLISCQLFSFTGGITSSIPTVKAGETQLPANEPTSTPEGPVKPGSVMASRPTEDFGITPLKEWKESPYKPQGDELPVNLEMVDNLAVTGGFTKDQTSFLSKSGFVVMQTGEEQFADIRNQVSENYGQPYYLTTDAAYHALHITFDALLKRLELEVLRQEAIDIASVTLDKVTKFSSSVKGTNLETDSQLAEAYLAVALKLFNPDAQISPELEKIIKPQIEQIMAGSGRDKSALIPSFEDDYGAYKPVGHYAGNPLLENYFRGMTWFGRVPFKIKNTEDPKFKPNRTPLIITLCLRQNKPIWERYTQMMDTLTFVVGPTDDGGPFEVGDLMDSVYGSDATLDSLKDDQKWQNFLSRVDELPQPQINSTFMNTTKALKSERSWRLMGQRFTLDAMIFQNMIFDKVGTDAKKREFPSGLDVMAVLGSSAALDAQKAAGETDYQNYLPQIEKLQKSIQAQPQLDWLGTFYSGWLYSFLPQIQTKTEAFPPLMSTTAWQNREVNTALGSWAELKHDTALYSKMPEFMGGGGPPSSPAAPAYVEPNPNVFYRLAYISKSIFEGLMKRGYVNGVSDYPEIGADLTFYQLHGGFERLAGVYTQLGDIAVKELQGQTLTQEDFDLIQSPIGVLEEQADFAQATGQDIKLPPIPVVAAVSGANNEVLEAGVGKVERIFVVVPINGQLQIAQGGVFSYYEFKQPRSDRLTDEEWQKKLTTNSPSLMAYTKNYLQPGGKTVDSLALRVGDIFIVNKKGATPPLNVRRNPSKTADVVDSLGYYTYFEITAGPEKADKLVWWKIKVFGTEKEGWVAGNPEWYDRAHGQ